jgi:PAS domain S-box-containing protein
MLALWLLLLVVPAPLAREHNPTRVLLIHSYHSGMGWVDALTEGAKSVIEKYQPSIYFQVDHLDLKHHGGEAYRGALAQLLREKYPKLSFDLIITADDAALEFVLAHRAQMFADVPVVFCGVGNFSPELVAGHRNLTGVVERADAVLTLQAALSLHPEARRLVIITDDSVEGKVVRREIEEARGRLIRSIELTFLAGLSITAVAERVAILPSDSVVYLGPFTIDPEGRHLDPFDVERALQLDLSAVPIYASNHFFLGRGIVGGYFVSGYEQGRTAAELGLRILKGEKADSIPVILHPFEPPKFDYSELQQFDIKPSSLPAASLIINQPISFYHRHQRLLFVGAVALALQSVFTVVLTLSTRRRRKAETALSHSEWKYRSLADNLPEIVVETDCALRITFMNHSGFLRLRYQPGDLNNALKLTDLVAALERETVRQYFSLMAAEEAGSLEISMTTKDGEVFPAFMRMAPIMAHGTRVGFRGLCVDISARKQNEDELRTLREQLEQRVRERTEELGRANQDLREEIEDRRRTESELKESRRNLRRLAAYLDRCREDENRHIAAEIHDQLGSSLTAARVELSFLERRARNDGETLERIETIKNLLSTLTDDVRRISQNLRPPLLEDFGLKAAIEWSCRDFQARTDIQCAVRLPDGEIHCEPPVATTLFRIMQEALTNVTRHAQAKEVTVVLEAEKETLRLEIRDNGIGIDPARAHSGSLGLVNMQERALRVGGRFSIERAVEGGTRILVRVPWRTPRSASSERV